MKPISVKERLPELTQFKNNYSEYVLMYSILAGWFIGRYRKDGYWFDNTNARYDNGDEITHWLPLPEKPD
jgi:hypothetical protein